MEDYGSGWYLLESLKQATASDYMQLCIINAFIPLQIFKRASKDGATVDIHYN